MIRHETLLRMPGGAAARERGSVLVVALVMLVVLAALAASAMSTSTLEQRMSVNSLEQNVAFQAAESGLKGGEAMVAALTAPDTGTSGCTAPCITTLDNVNGGIFANATGLPWGDFATYPEIGTVAGYGSSVAAPEYVVEYLGFRQTSNGAVTTDRPILVGSHYYRVTAMGVGRTTAASAQSVLQTMYARNF